MLCASPATDRPSCGARAVPIAADFAPGRAEEQRRPRNLHFPSHQQPFRRINSAEIQTKMKEIMQLTGILTIDGVVSGRGRRHSRSSRHASALPCPALP